MTSRPNGTVEINELVRRRFVYSLLLEAYTNPRDFGWATYAKNPYVIRNRKSYGFCTRLSNLAGLPYPERVCNLPELLAQKPATGWKKNRRFWWSPFKPYRRLKAVEKAIELCRKRIEELENKKITR